MDPIGLLNHTSKFGVSAIVFVSFWNTNLTNGKNQKNKIAPPETNTQTLKMMAFQLGFFVFPGVPTKIFRCQEMFGISQGGPVPVLSRRL